MRIPKFTVDTHLFRELGELLVGRDSTALVELIKNAYDADATRVIVDGHRLGDPEHAQITVRDDGVGMTEGQFTDGFLRIASRLKEEGFMQSQRYERRFTGAKGVGRLAAHKLARRIRINSVAANRSRRNGLMAIDAAIDWDVIESYQTLEDLDSSAITLEVEKPSPRAKPGTVIELTRLRRRWTQSERASFFAEVQTFSPPKILVEPPTMVVDLPLLFDRPKVYDTTAKDPGFEVLLGGELEAGEEYWETSLQAAHWIIEIDAARAKVRFHVAPTMKGRAEFPEARSETYAMSHPDFDSGPFFQARILVREGQSGAKERSWVGRSSGIRVYMEGFRVLPYGEPKDDWLSIDGDYSRRQKSLAFLSDLPFAGKPADKREGLLVLRNNSYFGAVFLTQKDAPTLRMLVNREGFIPEAGYEHLVSILRTAIYLSVRVRASSKITPRDERRERRKVQAAVSLDASIARKDLRRLVVESVEKASVLAAEANQLAISGDFKSAREKIAQAASEFAQGSLASERLMTEGSVLRVLASVGTQMASFVHEINSLLGSATALEGALSNLRNEPDTPASVRKRLAQLHRALSDLRRSIERQASYLTDVVTPDARRRRSRLVFSERFDGAIKLVELAAQRREIEILNQIPSQLKSPPMFPAELLVVFSNLLTNAVKAAGVKGRVVARGRGVDGTTKVQIENTGLQVDPAQGERWFRPFESTTVQTDPVLGQGMGMGLPITRNLLEEYGATVTFVQPSPGYSAAIEITFPR